MNKKEVDLTKIIFEYLKVYNKFIEKQKVIDAINKWHGKLISGDKDWYILEKEFRKELKL